MKATIAVRASDSTLTTLVVVALAVLTANWKS